MDESGAEDWYPRGETGGGGDARTRRGALRRRSAAGLARCARVVRAVPVGVVIAGLVTLSGMAVVLQLAGAWPFARPGPAAPDAVPGARLPLPPSAVGAGVEPSARGRDGGTEGRGATGAMGRGEAEGMTAPGGADGADGMDGQAMITPPPGRETAGREGGADSRGCRARWQVDAQWEDFNATVTVTGAAGKPVTGWEVSWARPGGQRLIKGWNGEFRDSGARVTVRNGPGNAEIPAGGETTFGFQASGSGSPAPRLVCRAL